MPSYEPFIDIPDAAAELQALYIGRGQGKVFYLKFELASDSLANLVIETCGSELIQRDNPFLSTMTDPNWLPEWWDAGQYDEMLVQSCINNGAGIDIGAVDTESNDRFLVYIEIAIL